MRRIRDETEKEHAFLGLCTLLQANPGAALAPEMFGPLCNAIGSWRILQHDGLRAQMQGILVAFRQHLGQDGWALAFGGLAEPLQQKLMMFMN